MSTAKRELIIQEADRLAARGKLDAAIKEYRRAVDLAPHDTNALNRLGDLLVRVSRIPEAIDGYQRIADHFSEDGFFLKAIAIYKKVRAGKIEAKRLGRMFVIPKSEIESVLGTALTENQKTVIDAGIKKAVKEYVR